MIGLSFFTLVALTYDKYSASELIAVMTCVSMVSILWQILKSNKKDERNTAARKFLSFVCGFLQLAGFVVVIAMTVSVSSIVHLVSMGNL